MGANIFFVLSGFLLSLPFVRYLENQGGPIRFLPYLGRRIKRVVPAYWFQIIILSTVLFFIAATPSWKIIVLHSLFLQNFDITIAAHFNGVYWTLPTEFGFYLLLPLFAAFAIFFSRHKRTAWIILSLSLIIFAIAYRTIAYATVSEETIDKKFFTLLQLPGLIDHFAIGMLLAWVYVRNRHLASSMQADSLLLVGLLGIISMMALIDHEYLRYWNGHILIFVGYTITAYFIGLLVLGTALAGPVSKAFFANPFMLTIGVISYSLYLWHLPIQKWTLKLLDYWSISGDRLWWLAAISIPLSILTAIFSYYYIERPFLRSGRSGVTQ